MTAKRVQVSSHITPVILMQIVAVMRHDLRPARILF